MSVYASLLNIDLNLPQNLVIYVSPKDQTQKIQFETETNALIAAKDTHNFLIKIYEKFDSILESFPEEGLCY